MGRDARDLIGSPPEAAGARAGRRGSRAGADAVGEASAAAGREAAPTWFLLAAPAERGATVSLPENEAHHALRVLRLGSGALVPATDGRGAVYRLRLLPRGRSCLAEVLERRDTPPDPHPIEVGIGAGRRERFLWCVEKLTELGAARVVPLVAGALHAPRTLRGEAGERYAGRARARAAAALKQSKGALLPEVESPVPPLEWGRRPFAGLSLLLALPAPGVVPLAAAVARRSPADGSPPPGGFRLAVGPEGGFAAEEEGGLLEAGFLAVHLGPRRLRFETAALVAASQVRAVLALANGGAGVRGEDAWTS